MKLSWIGLFQKRNGLPLQDPPRRDPLTVDITGTPLAGVIETAVKQAPVYVTTGGKPRAVLVDFDWWKRFSAEIEDASR